MVIINRWKCYRCRAEGIHVEIAERKASIHEQVGGGGCATVLLAERTDRTVVLDGLEYFKPLDGRRREQDPEVTRIVERVDVCLEQTNMSRRFKELGFDVIAREHAKHYMNLFRSMIPKTFNSNYYSPCWDAPLELELNGSKIRSKFSDMTFVYDMEAYREAAGVSLQHDYGGKFTSEVVCLPKVFVAGFPKCGTTYLYSLMTDGLGIRSAQVEKEPHWWVVESPYDNPHLPTLEDIPMYLFNFANGSRLIESGQYDTITIDSSPNIMFDWLRYYKNEPPITYCQMPAIIPEVLPDSKFIVTMRNPVKMMYSAFWFSCTTNNITVPEHTRLRGPSIFHERVVIKLRQFRRCLQRYSLEWCVVNITYNLFSPELSCGRTRIEMGLYYVHVHKWLSVVPRERFMFLTLEETSQNKEAIGRSLWEFIGIPGEYKGVQPFEADKNEQDTIDYRNDPRLQMRKDTEQILNDFFQPYNQKLADLLGDPKFLWEVW